MIHLIWFIVFLIMFASMSKLQDRVTRLEEKLRSQTQPTPLPRQALTESSSDSTAPQSVTTPVFTAPPAPRGPDALEQFFAWFKEDWLLKLGALLLLMGIGWFIAYAFTNNWIGPMGRIVTGVVLGLLAMTLGATRMRRYTHQGEIFLVVGGTTILLTLFAARSVYDFFSPAFVLGCMFLTAAVIALVSVYQSSRPLALSSLLMALVAPLFVASTQPDYVGLFAYLIVVILGTMWVVALRKQRTLILVALVSVWWYSLGAFLNIRYIPAEVHTVLYVLASVIALIFFISSVTNYARNIGVDAQGDALDVASAIGIGAFVWIWGAQMLAQPLEATALFGWAFLFLIGAFYAYLLSNRLEPVYAFGGVGALLLGIATSIQFSGHTLMVAWTLEAAVLTIGTLLMTRRSQAASWTSLAFAAPLLLSFEYFHFSNTPHYDDALVLALFSAVLLLAGSLLSLSWNKEKPETSAPLALLLVGALYAFIASATVWDGAPLTNVWSLLAVIATLATYALTRERSSSYVAALAFFFPAVRSIAHITAPSWDKGIVHLDALALILLATALLAVGALLRTRSSSGASDQEADPGFAIVTIASIYYAVILWLAAPTLFGRDYAVMGSLVIYTLVGLGFYLTGRAQRVAERTVYGAAVLGFVVLRLLIVDVWQMELSGRIITFLLIGTLLVTTAFIGRAPKESSFTSTP